MLARKKTLEELKGEAIAELERRGYDVRGKTQRKSDRCLKHVPEGEKQSPVIQETDSRACDC